MGYFVAHFEPTIEIEIVKSVPISELSGTEVSEIMKGSLYI